MKGEIRTWVAGRREDSLCLCICRGWDRCRGDRAWLLLELIRLGSDRSVAGVEGMIWRDTVRRVETSNRLIRYSLFNPLTLEVAFTINRSPTTIESKKSTKIS